MSCRRSSQRLTRPVSPSRSTCEGLIISQQQRIKQQADSSVGTLPSHASNLTGPCGAQMERRERLRKLMAALDEDTVADAFEALGPGVSVAEVAPTKEVFYTEGAEELLDARMQVRFVTCTSIRLFSS